jgi:hypothetical protein
MGTLDVKGVLNHTQVANVAQITSNSNVVMEYKLSTRDYETEEPRIALTASSDRGYVASASSTYNGDTVYPYSPWNVFDGKLTEVSGSHGSWLSASGTYDGNGAPSASPAIETTESSNTWTGEWLQLELPHKIQLTKVEVLREVFAYGEDRSPRSGAILGSNNGTTWSFIHSWANIAEGDFLTTAFKDLGTITTAGHYKYIRFVTTAVQATTQSVKCVSMNEIRYYGTPFTANVATGTDVVLHTTPNVPKLDFSNVYYDGQDYTSMPATVADKSGNGVTGTPSGGVGFDSTYKAFTFDGVDDKITATLTNPAGAWVHSTSSWFKINSYGSGNAIYSIDNDTTPVANQSPDFSIMPDGDIRYAFGANDIRFGGPGTIVPNKWYHIVSIYSGGSDASSRQVFLNGVELGQTDVYQAAALNGQANMILRIGVYANGSSYLNGSIANFRLYNQALSADEIWELYAYQKEYFGVSPDVVTLKAGRLGIGTSEPRAVLDVRGDIRGGCPVFFSCTASADTGVGAAMNWDRVHNNKGNGIAGTTFTAPLEGYYHMNVQGFSTPNATNTAVLRWWLNGLDNGASGFNPNDGTIYSHGDGHKHLAGSLIVYMRRGDYIQIKNNSSAGVSIHGSHNRFNGFYLSS